MSYLYKQYRSYIFLLIIILIGAFFRLYNINWDMNFHLHPDERFLTMIGIKETVPTSFWQYLDPATSPFNPYALGFGFFVYGVLPLTINVLLSMLFHTQLYNTFTLQGRILAAGIDVLSIVGIYHVASLLEKKLHLSEKVKFFSAFFYAITVLPIQLSHFFTVDIFLSFFILISIYFALRFSLYKSLLSLILTGITLGMAISCKINALAVIPLEIVLLLLPFFEKKYFGKTFFLTLLIFFICTYMSIRIGDPYLFETRNFFDARINITFLQSIQTLAAYANPQALYPPNIQWVNKLPIIFSLFNIAFFGLGIGTFTFMVLGIIALVKTKKVIALSLVTWVVLFFIYQSTQYVKTMRYFIFLYPFFAFFAGIGFVYFLKKKVHIALIVLSIGIIVIWPFSFFSIYTKPHVRITASEWIRTNIPAGSTILGEYWDDTLPLANTDFTIVPLHVFDADSSEKWTVLDAQLHNGDYLILSSNRAWGSIMANKKLYPQMSIWYQDLFAGKLSYKKVAEFSSYPSLSYLGIPVTIKDDIAEEAFTVYDHPVVFVFKNVSK